MTGTQYPKDHISTIQEGFNHIANGLTQWESRVRDLKYIENPVLAVHIDRLKEQLNAAQTLMALNEQCDRALTELKHHKDFVHGVHKAFTNETWAVNDKVDKWGSNLQQIFAIYRIHFESINHAMKAPPMDTEEMNAVIGCGGETGRNGIKKESSNESLDTEELNAVIGCGGDNNESSARKRLFSQTGNDNLFCKTEKKARI